MTRIVEEPLAMLAAERAFLSEVFHDLSQPLTALQCRLELSLRRDHTVEEFKESIQTVLENAERMRQRLLLLRALNDAADAAGQEETTDLNDLLGELRESLLPLFEAETRTLSIAGLQPSLVRGNRGRLMRALFYFVEYLFRYSKPNSILKMELLIRESKWAELRIAAEGSLPVGISEEGEPELRSLELEIARRTFRADGGDLSAVSWDANHSHWLVKQPLA